jgi:hypothetical protein
MSEIPSPPEFDALGYLQAVYQGKIIAESQRMKAAIEALPFEKPKLSMTATIDGPKVRPGDERDRSAPWPQQRPRR